MAQTAGELSGLMPGDLGDLGEASLTPRVIDDLLQLAMDRNGEVSSSSRVGDATTINLDEMQQTQLELIVRLLACGQRISLCRLEQERMGNRTLLLFDMIDRIRKPDDLVLTNESSEAFAASSATVAAKTPFMNYVLNGLYIAASAALSARLKTSSSSQPDHDHLPIITELANSIDSDSRPPMDPVTTRSLLQIVAACAEAFPSGACWASRSLSSWSEIPNEGREFEYNRHVHGCAPHDLAAVVLVVANILDAHGDHNGDAECQKWALRCLIRLAKATSCLTLADRETDSTVLGRIWQRVWSIIFHSELRYSAYTANTAPDSIAEMVLWTLSAITQHVCTDPHIRWSQEVRERRSTFLYRRQGDLWNLPVFSLVGDTASTAPFDVIVSLLRSVGLSEGSDSVSHGLKFKAFPLKKVPETTRRLRLVNFCLFSIATQGERASIGAAATSLAALAHGHESKWSKSLINVSSDLAVLNLPHTGRIEKQDTNLFSILWKQRVPVALSIEAINPAMDPVSNSRARLEEHVLEAENALSSADILASSQSLAVFDALNDFLSGLRGLDSANVEEPTESLSIHQANKSMLARIKVEICVLLSRNKGVLLDRAFERLAPKVAELFSQVSSNASFIIKEDSDFILEVLPVVDFVMLVTSAEYLDIPDCLQDHCHDLAEALESCLEKYCESDKVVISAEAESPSCQISAKDLDADDLEDRLEGKDNATNSRKRHRPSLETTSHKRSRSTLASKSWAKHALNSVRLLYALKPSLRTMRFVAEKLLGVDLDKPIAYYDSNLSVDPYIAACLAQLFTPLLRLHNDTMNSGAALLCRLVCMARRSSAPHSPLHLFGYQECSRFCLTDGWQGLPVQSQSDSRELLTVWADLDQAELRSRSLRPCIRITSICSLSKAFTGGDDGLRAQWGKEYPKQVIASFFDRNAHVRKLAVIGLAGSLASTSDKDQVIDSALRNLPPLSSEEEEFREWYSSVNGDAGLTGRQAWEDARIAVDFFSLLSKALLGGCATKKIRQESMLFSIIEVAQDRGDLEPVCFMMTDFFATISGFGTAEIMLAEFLDGLIRRWLIRSAKEGLLELPLLLSAPGLVRFLIRNSSFSCFQDDVVGQLREHGAREFFVRNSRFALPRLLRLADPSQPDRRLRDFCSLYDDESECDKTIAKLVRGHISSLSASAALLQCTSSNEERKLSDALRFYADEDVLVQLKRRYVSSTARYFIEQASFDDDGASGTPSFFARVADKFTELSGLYGDGGVSDPFRQVGLTLSECCIMSRVWSSPSAVEWLGQRRINNIKVLWSIVSRGTETRKSEAQLDFLFLLFSELCSSYLSDPLLQQGLKVLKNIFVQLTSGTSPLRVSRGVGFKNELRVLFCSVVRLHERYQQNALNNSKATNESQNLMNRRARGLASDLSFSPIANGETGLDSPIKGDSVEYEHDILELLSISYAVLETITENCHFLGLDLHHDLRVLIPRSCSETEKTQLGSIGHNFSLSDLCLENRESSKPCTSELYRRLASKVPMVIASRASTKELSPRQHLLLSELNDLFNFLSEMEQPALISTDRANLLRNLSGLCLESPAEISGAASRCIGALQCTESFDHDISSPTSSFFVDGQLEPVLEATCLELLMEMLKSPRVSTAQTAMETVKVLLSTKRGTERGDASAQLLRHFVPSTRVRTASLLLNASAVKKIKDCFESNETWVEWCWDEEFWVSCLECHFDEWICKVVPAIISCHFNELDKNATNAEAGRFVSYCQHISHIEPNFALSLFPLLILQLLREQQSNIPSPQSQVQGDAWIGDPSSPTTLKISRCFAAVLRKCAEQPRVRESRAVGLLVDTLDMIRRLEQHKFLISNGHVKNPTSMKAFKDSTASPKSSSQESQPSTEDYPLERDPVKWTGIPFGVGLFINGIRLAEACYKVKRYFSAIFYAEHYADVMFGGSTRNLRRVIEEFTNDPKRRICMTSDISGFPVSTSLKQVPREPSSLIEEARAYFELMVKCSKSLSANDHMNALLAQLSDIRLMPEKASLDLTQVRHNTLGPTETLRLVDSQISPRDVSEQNQIAFDCLSELHLHGILQTTIEGFVGSKEHGYNGDSRTRERWFEACLFGNCLDSFHGRAFSQTQPSSDQNAGFCESVLTALLSLTMDDYNICRIHIENARFSTIEHIAECVASEASSLSSSSLIDKLHCLNDLEAVVAMESLGQTYPQMWKGDGSSGIILERTLGIPRSRIEQPFTSRVQELVLQQMSTQDSKNESSAAKLLSSLLWRNANISCETGRTGDAQAAFQRLARIHGSDPCHAEFFRVRHLEARVLEQKGDFSSAIRHVSQSMDRLALVRLNKLHDETEADLMICCGRWMATHRVDSGENVLNKYLRPGLELARKIHTDHQTIEAAGRVAEACIALGDLVFSIYETVAARVKSPEWKTAGLSLATREAELKEYDGMVKGHGKKKSKPSQHDWDQWLKDLLIFKYNLSRDVQQIRSEREKVEKSIEEYKDLAMRTLIEALSVADDNYRFMSKYVYRIVAIWFSPGGAVLEDPYEFDTIPSYRFVPLANQLFSRLTESNLTLKRLAKRLCSDHPYHCLSQMVRIGKSPVNERDAEKAAVANEALQSIKSESPEFLAHLIENYESLLKSYVYLAEAGTENFLRGTTKKIGLSAVYNEGKVTRLDQCVGRGARKKPCPPCVLTKTPSLRPRCDYGGGVDDPVGGERIDKFDDHFSIAESGITRPKIVVCIGSKGGRFKQLVKGGVRFLLLSSVALPSLSLTLTFFR